MQVQTIGFVMTVLEDFNKRDFSWNLCTTCQWLYRMKLFSTIM